MSEDSGSDDIKKLLKKNLEVTGKWKGIISGLAKKIKNLEEENKDLTSKLEEVEGRVDESREGEGDSDDLKKKIESLDKELGSVKSRLEGIKKSLRKSIISKVEGEFMREKDVKKLLGEGNKDKLESLVKKHESIDDRLERLESFSEGVDGIISEIQRIVPSEEEIREVVKDSVPEKGTEVEELRAEVRKLREEISKRPTKEEIIKIRKAVERWKKTRPIVLE